MDLYEAMKQRHSVRSYLEKPIDPDAADKLEKLIDECNQESGLHIQLVKDEAKAFNSAMARYGNFSGVTNYIAVIGKKGRNLEELCGYYGEKLVLEAQRMGLNTCWVALTFKKVSDAYTVDPGEKLAIVIAVGYGKTAGIAHRSKSPEAVSNINAGSPDWFRKGIEAVLLAPTALNQQKFRFELAGDKVKAKAGFGFYTKIDLGIAKYHFELGSGKSSEETGLTILL
jgi:hypothetical protein